MVISNCVLFPPPLWGGDLRMSSHNHDNDWAVRGKWLLVKHIFACIWLEQSNGVGFFCGMSTKVWHSGRTPKLAFIFVVKCLSLSLTNNVLFKAFSPTPTRSSSLLVVNWSISPFGPRHFSDISTNVQNRPQSRCFTKQPRLSLTADLCQKQIVHLSSCGLDILCRCSRHQCTFVSWPAFGRNVPDGCG